MEELSQDKRKDQQQYAENMAVYTVIGIIVIIILINAYNMLTELVSVM